MKWQPIPWAEIGQRITSNYLGTVVISRILDVAMVTSVTLSSMLPLVAGWVTEEPFRTDLANFAGGVLGGGMLLMALRHMALGALWRKGRYAPYDAPAEPTTPLLRLLVWFTRQENSAVPLGVLIVFHTLIVLCLDLEADEDEVQVAYIYMAIAAYIVALLLYVIRRIHREANGATLKERVLFGSGPDFWQRGLWLFVLSLTAVLVIYLRG